MTRGRAAGTAAPEDEFSVPVTIYLPKSTYRLFAGAAAERKLSVGQLVALVVIATHRKPPPKQKRPFTQADLDRIKALHAEGLSDLRIAATIGRAQSKVSDHRRKMGLPRNFEPGFRRSA